MLDDSDLSRLSQNLSKHKQVMKSNDLSINRFINDQSDISQHDDISDNGKLKKLDKKDMLAKSQ